MVVTASVRLVRAIQRLASEEGSFCLVAVRFERSENILVRLCTIFESRNGFRLDSESDTCPESGGRVLFLVVKENNPIPAGREGFSALSNTD